MALDQQLTDSTITGGTVIDGVHGLGPWATADLLNGVLDSSHDGIMAFRSRRDDSDEIVEFEWLVANPAAQKIVGKSACELLGRGLLELLPGHSTSGLFDQYVAVVETGHSLTVEHHYDHDGLDTWFLTTAVQLGDGFAVTFRDVSEQKRAHAALAHQEFHDTLTGLPNAALLDDRIQHALRGIDRRSGHVGVIAIEVEDVHQAHDVLDHEAGSQMLVEIARRIDRSVRASDTVARFVGHHFVVLCPHLDGPNAAQPVALRIAACFATPITIDGRRIEAAAHIGVATTDDSSTRSSALIRDADTAVHRARIDGLRHTPGVTTIDYFDEELRAAATDRLRRELDLKHAIANDEFQVHYQTIHQAHTLQTVGLEALVRWQHPVKGLLAAGDFVHEAVELDLIVQLGDVVRRTVIDHLRAWQGNPFITHVPCVGINASAFELALPDYAQRVIADLEAAGVSGRHICIEVTETILMNDPVAAGATLRSLSDHGITVALDDFGTGYSALDFMRRFPVDVVKVDRSFTANIAHDTTDQTIVTAILDLARSLGKTTVAEGIETIDQLEIVTRLGVDRLQGYHFAAPLPHTEITDILASPPS